VIEVLHQPTGQRYEVVPLFAVFVENGQSMTYSPPLRVEEWNLEVQFSSVVPDENAIELNVTGLNSFIEEDWIFVTAEKKPFVSAVWLGTFLLMAGFSVSTLRHWHRDRELNRKARSEDFANEP
jgi:cytochrome c-type biogenesis protein CcmF